MSASNKRKTLLAFFDSRLKRINPSTAELATSAEREVPRAGFMSASDKRKMLLAFFDFRRKRIKFIIRRSYESRMSLSCVL